MVINYNSDAEQAAQTAKEVEMLGVTALTIQANIADWEQVKRMFSQVHDKIGNIDILVNNASVFKQTPFPTDSIEDWHAVTGVLINGAFYVSNLAARDMLEKKQGVIINIVDISVWEAGQNLALT